MRYLVVCFSHEPEVAPFVIAEVVRDGSHLEVEREDSLAGAIAGPGAVIATREELLKDAIGRRALEAWEARDDSDYDRETGALAESDDEVWPKLRLVPPPNEREANDG